jgi:hypothetical protein
LMISATARARGVSNARSSDRAIVDSKSPGRSGVTTPMTPAMRTTGTTGIPVRNRRGINRAHKSMTLRAGLDEDALGDALAELDIQLR